MACREILLFEIFKSKFQLLSSKWGKVHPQLSICTGITFENFVKCTFHIVQQSIWKRGQETLLRRFWRALNAPEQSREEKPTCVALSLIQGAACPRLSRGQCPARYGAASVSREEVRRIMLEGLEEGGRVLSPRYKAKVFIKKKKKFRRKRRN